MKRLLTNKILGLAGLMFVLPVIGSATSFSLISMNGGGTAGSSAASVSFADLLINGTFVVDTITETYNYAGGVGTITLKAGTSNSTYGFVAGQTFLTITENGSNLLPSSGTSAINLYQNVTSFVFNDTILANVLGQYTYSFSTPAALAAAIAGGANAPVYSVTAPTGSVTSATTAMTFNTPEPSTFAMLGIVLFAGVAISFRKKLALNKLRP